MFKVFLKLSDQNSAVLLQQVKRSWTIADLKRYIVTQHPGVQAENLRLIFSGRELPDELYVKDCDIDQNTTLFAVCKPPTGEESSRQTFTSLDQSGSVYSSLHSQIEDLNNHHQESAGSSSGSSSLKPQLYVYCRSPCDSVQPGKLRVCCSQCKQGSFTVQQDPTCWEDVLIAGKISGVCEREGCHGNASEFYFKCANHPTSEEERAVVLRHIKTNTRQVTCLTCADIRNPVLVFPCTDRHTICLECFHDYCHVQLNERQFVHHDELGYTLPCPSGCENSFITEIHHFKILGGAQYGRYKQFAAEECLLRSGGVLCPTPGCGAGILPNGGRRVECVKQGQHGCGAVFCKNCLRPYHSGDCHDARQQQRPEDSGGSGYQVDSLRVEQARWERQKSEETIHQTTKPCPRCKTPTERNGGCMHMTCTRPRCKLDWCWVCEIEWNPQCMADHWFDVN